MSWWDKIRKSANDAWDWTKNAAGDAWDWTKNAAGDATDYVKKAYAEAEAYLQNALSSLVNTGKNVFSGDSKVSSGNYGIVVDKSKKGRDHVWSYTLPDGTVVHLDDNTAEYKFNNFLRTSKGYQMDAAAQFMVKYGRRPTLEELNSILNSADVQTVNNAEWKELQDDMYTFETQMKAESGYTLSDIAAMVPTTEAGQQQQQQNTQAEKDYNAQAQDKLQFDYEADQEREQLFNPYYRDIYSTQAQTLGGSIYDRLVGAEQNAAISNMQLADAQMQQQAMAQAETVKAIADQVRAERVARLRAGMSESQIANQDMQTLMANMNTLNQQAQDLNYARLQANQQYNLAQDTAYQQWLSNANTMAQSGTGFAASDAGDLTQQALRYSKLTGTPLTTAYKKVSGSSPTS